jgi:hypothetical protein
MPPTLDVQMEDGDPVASPAITTSFHPLKKSVPLRDGMAALNVGRSKAYELLALGLLEAVKNGMRTEITVESIRRYQASMPRATYKAPKPRLDRLHKLHERQREKAKTRREHRNGGGEGIES